MIGETNPYQSLTLFVDLFLGIVIAFSVLAAQNGYARASFGRRRRVNLDF